MDKTDIKDHILKWKKAVLHIECAADPKAFVTRDREMQQLAQLDLEGRIDREELVTRISEIGGHRSQNAAGTALYLKDGEYRFLLTSKRVVEVESRAQRRLRHRIEDAQRLQDRTGPLSESARREIERAREEAGRRISGAILRVPTLNDILNDRIDGVQTNTLLAGLNNRPYDESAYTYARNGLDLAVISLSGYEAFVEKIEALGHQPIDRSDLAAGPSHEGAEVFTVGYPFAMSVIDRRTPTAEPRNRPSLLFAEPTFAFGRISMLHEHLSYFWADMNIYPGNNGGPVVENEKLVGVVSGQRSAPLEETDVDDEGTVRSRRARVPFDRITKAEHVGQLLDEQIEKEADLASK